MKRKYPAMMSRRGRGLLGVDGAAAVEFAITAPLLVVLVLGIADYGFLMGTSASLEGAARAGAEVAKANPERHRCPAHRSKSFSDRGHAHRDVRLHMRR